MTDTLYCKVTDGAVVRGPEPLPLHDEGVLNLRAASDPRPFGWYPVVMVDVPEGQRLVNVSYVLVDDAVEQQGDLEDLPLYVPPVPDRVTARQARLALNAAGMLDDVDAAIAASSREIQLAWEYATEIERANPILAQVASGFGLTDAQMDDLFRQAATL